MGRGPHPHTLPISTTPASSLLSINASTTNPPYSLPLRSAMRRRKEKQRSKAKGEEQETIEAIKANETNEFPEASSVQMSDNIVLRKLLRGPRYFDPPDADSNWGTCVNCGEGDHTAVNCKAGKRKKPCFVCGSFEHAAKQCKKDCFICKKGGHQAKDCPEKTTSWSESGGLCLKCGQLGHEMFQCKNSYSSDDLKEIQCHNVLACTRLRETACFKCGEEGHFARECNSAKAKKKYRLLLKSLRIRLRFHEEKDYIENGSAPPDIGKAHKRKKIQNDDMVARLLENTRLPEGTTGATTPSSCFKCGEAVHFAGECTSSGKGLLEETTGAATPDSCLKCGEEGHFAHECSSAKDKYHDFTFISLWRKTCSFMPSVLTFFRQRRSLLLKSLRIRLRFHEEKDYIENGSAPPDIGKAHKRKKIQNDDMVAQLLENTSSGKGLLEETTGAATPDSCLKCGEEGHFADECSSAKARKMYRLFLKSLKFREEKDGIENGSEPPDMGKADKRKKIQNDDMVARLLENLL
ncbi:hypothetical protein K1719_012230 [Acacia pycnantha]|nr:hypothetical protein K1719_012230 [Acacia pycnantha]